MPSPSASLRAAAAGRPALLAALVLALLGVAPPLAADSRTADRPAPAPSPTPTTEAWAAWEQHRALEDASLFRGLPWRSVGPVVQGGRVSAIASVPDDRYTFYVAYASGGLWRTTDNGHTFTPLFDHQPTMIMGDVAVAPSQPRTVWVGTGENNASRSSYGGLGVFRSDDAGETWTHRGLDDIDRTGRIVIDPRDADRVYVAAAGPLYTSGGSRGVFRTVDGGASWTHVLDPRAADDAGPDTGIIDLILDPFDPDTLYAAAWERSRRPWNFVASGVGSAIWKSTDGGDTWMRLGGGFPTGADVGRIGLAASPSRRGVVYASVDHQGQLPVEKRDLGDSPLSAARLETMDKADFLAQDPDQIEAFIRSNDLDTSLDADRLIAMIRDESLSMDDLRAQLADANAALFDTSIRGIEVWRSDDGGATWRRTHDEPIRDVVFTYGYYFGEIRVAPDDPDRIYVLGVPAITSGDGGATFVSLHHPSVHVDHHALWIDPHHPQRMIIGNDGGLDISHDGGISWRKLDAEAVGQFYTIHVDDAEPYNVYGGLQDNGVLKGSSRHDPARWGSAWARIGGGDGMYVQVDPRDNVTTYLGSQFGFYRRIGGGPPQEVRPRDALDEPALRYNWATPIHLSVHSPDVLYFGANRVYRSLDRGVTWTAISDDLTTSPLRGNVPFGTLTTLAESPQAFGLLWAGTDDGHVHVTVDGGVTWRAVDGKLPRDRWVSRVEPSPHVRARAYVSLNGYRDDDRTAYLYRTDDLGATWRSIADGLPAEPINVVREDPVNADVVYVGTDAGVYVSLDGGDGWQALQANLPNVPVHDLIVQKRAREVVIGTHGRSVWIVDALPVQELTADVRAEAVRVFPVEPIDYRRSWQGKPTWWFPAAAFEPEMTIPFWTAHEGEAVHARLDRQTPGRERTVVAVAHGQHRLAFVRGPERDRHLGLEGRGGEPPGRLALPAAPVVDRLDREDPH
ncbi:MAG: hypothetical protein AAF772_15180, partial [Acidobacteriota bacterium]